MFFVCFLQNRSVLLTNLGVMCDERDFDLVRRNWEKVAGEIWISLEYKCVWQSWLWFIKGYVYIFFVYLSYLYIISVVIYGGGKDWAVIFGGSNGNGCWTMLFILIVSSNLSVRLLCSSIWILCSCISLWISCRYCNLFTAQLCGLLLSWCWPNNGGGATNVFKSNRSGLFWDDCSWYREPRLIGKLRGNVDGDIWLKEGVEGRESVSGNVDSVVSNETSTGLFYKIWFTVRVFVCPPLWTAFCGCWVIKRIFSNFFDVGVEPK